MGILLTIIIEIAIVLLIHFVFDFKKMNKVLGVFIILGIVFLSLSLIYVFRDYTIDLKSLSGIFEIIKVYFSWIISVLGNIKDITADIINMDWRS